MKSKRIFKNCPRCGADLEPTTNLLDGPSTNWLECVQCNTFVDTYQPMPHQYAVHRDEHRIIGNFGGFGTGKTFTSEKEIEKHLLITEGANILVGANVSSQYDQTILRDFERSFPKAFMTARNKQQQQIDFINDARLMTRPFDDPDKLRSYNLTMAVILEGSEVVPDAFHMLKTRIRNISGVVPEVDKDGVPKTDQYDRIIPKYDWRKIIVESNPDSGWVKSDVLEVSDEIHKHGSITETYQQNPLTIDPSISSHVSSTDVNTFLPADYIELNTKNKPDWWVQKFIYGSFSFASGLVYPRALQSIIEPIKLDPKWLRIAAHDYGLRDKATFVFGAIDSEAGILYIYKAINTTNRNIEELANIFKEAAADVPVGGWYTTPLIDPKNNKRDYNKKDLITHYADYGISFQPGHIGLDARIFRLNTYFETGRIKIFDTCTDLIEELRGYKFPDQTLNSSRRSDKPIDARNHSINPVEWITMALPSDPKKLQLGVYNAMGVRIDLEDEKKNQGGWQLGEDDFQVDQDYYGVEEDVWSL